MANGPSSLLDRVFAVAVKAGDERCLGGVAGGQAQALERAAELERQ